MQVTELEELDFDWTVPGALGEGYLPKLQRLQRQAPVFWSGHQKAWIVTRHADIVEGLRDPRLSNQRFHLPLEKYVRNAGMADSPLIEATKGWLFNMDGVDHGRLRRLLMKPFGRAEVVRHRAIIETYLSEILAEADRRPSVEFVHDVALPFAAGALLRVVGLENAVDTSTVIGWAETISAVFATAVADGERLKNADRTIREITELLSAEIADRRKAPRADLMTAFVRASTEDGDSLSEGEIIGLFQVLLLAAFDTTASTLGLIVPVLDSNSAYRAYIREHPDRMPEIIEELQRQVGMLNMMHRLCAQDFEWHGSSLRQGDMVYLMLGAGNWDQSVYPRPEIVDFGRKREMPLMFAPGIHHCIGHNLAKLEIEVALSVFCRSYDRVRVLNERLEYNVDFIIRSFAHLDVRFER